MKKRVSVFCILAAGCLWGMIGVFVRMLSSYGINSMQLTFLRSLVTVFSVVTFTFLTDPSKLRVRRRDLWCFAGSGICSIVFFNFCYFQAIRLTSLSVAAILLYTAPMIVTVLSAVLFHERITVRKAVALALAFLGCALVSGVTGGAASVSATALLFGLGSGFGYALYSIFGHYALKRYDSLTVTAYTFLFSSAGCVPLLNLPPLFRTAFSSPGIILTVVVFGIVTSAVPYVLYTYGLNHVETSHASIIASVEPVTATVIGIIFYHETVSAASAAGSLLVLAAVFLLNGKTREEKKNFPAEAGRKAENAAGGQTGGTRS